MMQIGTVLDQCGNVVGQHIFNNVLIVTNGYKFGNVDETISSVIGKNQQTETLTIIGKILNWILNKIEKDHSIKSIEKNP